MTPREISTPSAVQASKNLGPNLRRLGGRGFQRRHSTILPTALRRVRNEGMPIIRERLLAFPRFQALADIANAGKHLELDRGPRTGLAAQHFKIGQGAAFSDGTYFSDETTFSDAPEVVRVPVQGRHY